MRLIKRKIKYYKKQLFLMNLITKDLQLIGNTFEEIKYLPVLKHGPRSLTWMRKRKVITTLLFEKKLT